MTTAAITLTTMLNTQATARNTQTTAANTLTTVWITLATAAIAVSTAKISDTCRLALFLLGLDATPRKAKAESPKPSAFIILD